MWGLDQVCCIGFLLWTAVIDLRFRRIPVCLLAFLNLLAVVWQLYRFFSQKGDIGMLLGGMGVGAVFFLVSRFTGEGIGYGDSWVILILGIYLGLWEVLEVLAGTCLLLAAASIICMAVKRMSGRGRLPFVPFVAAGYLMSVVCAGYT